MNVFLWTVAGLLAPVFGAARAMKLGWTRQQLAASGLGWKAEAGRQHGPADRRRRGGRSPGTDTPGTARHRRGAGTCGRTGPCLPHGLAVLMAGAAVLHGRRKEPQMIAVNAILLALAVVVAWGRLGPYAF